MSYVFLFIFCHWRSFSPWWPLAFPDFPPPLQNFYVVPPTKKCLVWPFIARSSFLSLFFSLSFSGLLPSLSFFCLSLSLYFKFVDMTIILTYAYTLTTLKQKQFPLSLFVFIDSIFSCLCLYTQDAGGYGISRQNNLMLPYLYVD